MPSLETNSVSGFRSSSFFTLASGCASRTCGSFWNIDATATVGMLLSTASKVCSVFAAMKKSIFAEIIRMRLLTLRPAGHDGDVEAVFLVGAVGDRLEEAAVLGLRHPVGAEGHLVQRLRRRRQACGGGQAPKNR